MTDLTGQAQSAQAVVGLSRVQTIITEEYSLGRVYHNDMMVLQDAIPNRGNLLPGTLAAALRGENPLRNAIKRLTTPVVAGGAQWNGDEQFPSAAKELLKKVAALLPAVVHSLALHGKAAVFPHYPDRSALEPDLTVLRGVLFPVMSESRPDTVERLLVFTPREGQYGRTYAVTEYGRGRVTRYRDTLSPIAYESAGILGSPATMPHSMDRLPVAYRHVELDDSGLPVGPGHHAMNAMRRYVARLAQENIVYDASAGPQRVITGDMGGVGNIAVGPYKLLRLPLGADYKIVGPDVAALKQHTEARTEASQAVLTDAGSPEGFVGAGDAAEARQIAGQMHEQTCGLLADLAAEVLTDTARLLYRMDLLPLPITFTVRASFPAKRSAEQANITAMHSTNMIDRYEALLRLQDVGVKISDEELERAKNERERLESQIPDALATTLLESALPWVALKALSIAYPQLGITEADIEAQKATDMTVVTPTPPTDPPAP